MPPFDQLLSLDSCRQSALLAATLPGLHSEIHLYHVDYKTEKAREENKHYISNWLTKTEP